MILLEATQPEKITLFALLFKGGWVMVPLLLLFGLTIFLITYKYFYLRNAATVNDSLLQAVINCVKKGDRTGAMNLCATDKTELARILERGLMRLGSSMSEIESGMESAVAASVARFDRHMSVLAALSKLAPMLGFLGTVLGMITIFSDIAGSQDVLSISTIANGMYVKMVSSAAGLTVGILANVGYTYLNNMIDDSIARIEDAGNSFVDTLYKPQGE
jgi:biopolymer transport protein ExbB